jgi:hypothetical protein
VRRSSVHETLPALWGLHEYATATGDARCRRAVAAERLLERHVVFAAGTVRPLTDRPPSTGTPLTHPAPSAGCRPPGHP